MEKRVFISYAHADAEACKTVCEAFAKFNIPIWIDEERLSKDATADFDKEIEKAINDCSCFICLFTSNIKNSKYCGDEFKYALKLKEADETKERHFFILQIEKGLDPSHDFPPGCNIHSTGANILYAYDSDRLFSAISGINDILNKKIIAGKLFEEVLSDINRYARESLQSVSSVSQVISNIHDELGELVQIEEISKELVNGINFKIEGERGAGKSLILSNIYRLLLLKLNDDLRLSSDVLYVPIKARMEDLWDLSVFTSNVLFVLCDYYNVPYTLDERVKYILIIDGNRGCSRGNIPDVVNAIDDSLSHVYSKILSHCNKLVLLDTYINLEVQLLKLGEILACVTKHITTPSKVSRFFQGLLSRSFDDCGILFNNENDYFLLLKKIFLIFKNDACIESGGSLRTNEEGFYDVNLASTTQRGRLPQKLSDNERVAWKKLIRGNEVFLAIRNPFYLEWLINLYIADNDMVFPFRLRTLQAMICKNLVSRIKVHEDVKENLVFNFLHPLAVEIACKNGDTKMCVLKSSFKTKTNETEFEAQAKLLIDAGLVSQIGDDLLFTQQFIYEHFLQYSNESSYTQLETNLRICKLPEVAKNFIEFIKCNEPYSNVGMDSVEIAARILLDERKDFIFTKKEKDIILEIVRDRLEKCIDIKQKISIYDGIGLLFNDISLICQNQDLFDLNNEDLWVNIGSNRMISKYPITFCQFKEFVIDGYQNEECWKFGTNSLLLSNGARRTKPLAVDSNTQRIFEISNHPVVGVTWYEAKAYCSWLTKKIREKNNNDSLKVCLPEINEIIELFEKHCNLEDKIQAFNCIMTDHTIPIGVLPFYEGISDLIGNVWEWSETGYEFEDDYIMTCYGGCWGKEINSKNLRTTYPSKLQSNNIGFRVIIKNI